MSSELAGFKNIMFIRHGEIPREKKGHLLHDPLLTEHGRRQCERLRKHLDDEHLQIDLILCSPMRDVLQTLTIALQDYLHKNPTIPVQVLPLLQDCKSNNVGSDVEQLEQEFPNYDYSACHNTPFPGKRGINASNFEMSVLRARILFEYLAALPQKNIIVVTHDSVIRLLQGKQKPTDNLDAPPKEESFTPCEHEFYTLRGSKIDGYQLVQNNDFNKKV
ncbi:phosphoglycerate mutase family protein [Schizosaccharomyces japonicus yFS275]|uniref:Phosphoglycerate mutase family protein n=1 Tax=Schizosaccharomyces japonicus (strain yFS275 / FY16936) TaxID=402676 RepID=B6K4Z9_SCHJY|nr:phosphoglycerate mutase family protein [Schizosaccharomyces japonicus yFS275]EEB08556.1 phosphoglycerate mutase family protein [Schizosaccharomyces japonicus yFS275]